MSTEAAHITPTGRQYRRPPGNRRKLSRQTRADLYQLHLTVVESVNEIRRILESYGITGKDGQRQQMNRIILERGA